MKSKTKKKKTSSKITEHLTLFKQKMNKTRVDMSRVDIQLNTRMKEKNDDRHNDDKWVSYSIVLPFNGKGENETDWYHLFENDNQNLSKELVRFFSFGRSKATKAGC